jgi:hypothetical protein
VKQRIERHTLETTHSADPGNIPHELIGNKLVLKTTGKTYRTGVSLHSVGAKECATDDNKIATWRKDAQIREYLEGHYPHKMVIYSATVAHKLIEPLGFPLFPVFEGSTGPTSFYVCRTSLNDLKNCCRTLTVEEIKENLRTMQSGVSGDREVPINAQARWVVFSADGDDNTCILYFATVADAVLAKFLIG